MIKFENTDVWGFEHAIRGMPAKGYRQTRNGRYETFVSDYEKYINLGTYDTEEEARGVVDDYKINRYIKNVSAIEDDVNEGIVYERNYIVYPSGNIFNLYGHLMVGSVGRDGYRHVIVNSRNRDVHRIIAEIFVENPNNYEQVNHINGVKTDNRASNLEWCTRSQNLIYAYELGLEKKQTGEKHHAMKLLDEDVEYIRDNYWKRDPEFGAIALSRKFGVDPSTIRDIVNYKSRI